MYQGTPIAVQVKSLQTNSVRRTDKGYVGSFQCDASDKRPVRLPNGDVLQTTCLAVGGFDLVAVNLFEFGQQWRFAFAKNADPPARNPPSTGPSSGSTSWQHLSGLRGRLNRHSETNHSPYSMTSCRKNVGRNRTSRVPNGNELGTTELVQVQVP